MTCNTGISPGQSVVYTVEVLVDGNFSGNTQSTWSTFFFNGTDPDDTDDEVTLQTLVGDPTKIFSDGFESGNTTAWQ